MSSVEWTLRIFVALLVTAGICCGSLWAATPAPDTDASRVDLVLVTHLERGVLEGSDLPVIWKGASFFLALWDAEQQSAAAQATIPFEVLAKEFDASRKLQLIEAHYDQAPPEKWSGRVLWHEGRKWILEMDDREIEELHGYVQQWVAELRHMDKHWPDPWSDSEPAWLSQPLRKGTPN